MSNLKILKLEFEVFEERERTFLKLSMRCALDVPGALNRLIQFFAKLFKIRVGASRTTRRRL